MVRDWRLSVMQKEWIHRIAVVQIPTKKRTMVINVRNGNSWLNRISRGYLRATRFRSLTSSSTSIGSGETWITLIFWFCDWIWPKFRELLVLRFPIFEPVLPIYVPAFMLPVPGEEAMEVGSVIEIGAEEESSIIITACRRLAPAPMSIGVSGDVPEEVEEGNCSARGPPGEFGVGDVV